MKKLFVLSLLAFVYACSAYRQLPEPVSDTGWRTQVIPPSPQAEPGDPERGFTYLIHGDYIGSGLPLELLQRRLRKNEADSVLARGGKAAQLPYVFNAFETANGEWVANGNCFTCHAGELNGEIVLGLGNSWSEFDRNWRFLAGMTNLGMNLKYKKEDPEYQAFQPFGKYLKAIAPYIRTEQAGVNPAAVLAEACVRHRDPVTLTYVEEPNFEMIPFAFASDVPPLWNVGKKNALYYSALGRGDFSKLLFQASVLGIPDSAAARQAVDNFRHVVAWLKSLEPPSYPGPVDASLAAQGELIFTEHCSGCHGIYGEEESYPNKLVSVDVVKTDPLYATYGMQAQVVDWYNESWFAQTPPYSHLEPAAGYIAPPLDGIWATAPYLHNGSVPTLEDLLNSTQRPQYWSRSGDSRDYDYQKVGWNYRPAKKGKWAYDTTKPGQSNQGHYFGDRLSDGERAAVIEYLKTL